MGFGLFGVLRGTMPNSVGGLAHWIQTVYGESSSSDDTMWAACSSQNANVPCESEKKEKKKREKKRAFHRNNLVNTVVAQRENTCDLPKFWHGAVRWLLEPYLVEWKSNSPYSDDKTHPESGRKLQSQSQIRSERTTETGEGEQRGAEMIQLCWDSRLQTQTRVR